MKHYYKLLYNIKINREISIIALIKRLLDNSKTLDSRLKRLIETHKYQEAVNYIEKNNLQSSLEIKRIYAYCLNAAGDLRSREIMRVYVEERFGVTTEELILFLNDNVANLPLIIKYEYLGGLGNYGVFIAYKENAPHLLIKVLGDGVSDNEIEFYRKIYNEIDDRSFVPELYGIYNYGRQLTFLVTEYVNPKTVDSECDKYAILVSQELRKIKQERLFKLIPMNHFYKGNSEISYLHKRLAIQMMGEKMNNILSNDSSCCELWNKINNILKLIIHLNLFKRIVPEIHYCFCHNDFHRKNMFKQNDNSIKVFDWNNYRVGLIGWDMAYYWGNFECSFAEIKNKYVKEQVKTFRSDDHRLTWELFFYLCLVYVWVARLHGESANKYMSEFFCPAICEIEDIISKFG